MSLPLRISASILSADFACLGDQIAAAEVAGADWIHIDVMDGSFVPDISYGLPIIRAARRCTTLPLDVHLMIVHPERHIASVAAAGATIITVHVETCQHLSRVVQQIREEGCQPAVALNPHTPVVMVEEMLPLVDMVLVMTVNPGYPGQRFLPQTLRKIERIRMMARAAWRDLDLQVDGGIGPSTAPQVVAHGANVLVAGSAIFGAPDGIRAGIESLRTASMAIG
ncbi:MAG: ribulose-phosphate 3-epimerase [Chloroflexi bacterium]|nr:ribulose-phosphate 3-epimerase [Chloroflexota bacterium]